MGYEVKKHAFSYAFAGKHGDLNMPFKTQICNKIRQ